MKKSKDDYLTIFFISIIGIYIFIALAFPMYAILSKSVENKDGIFIGFEPATEIHTNTVGGIFSTIFSGEGFVSKIENNDTFGLRYNASTQKWVVIQSANLPVSSEALNDPSNWNRQYEGDSSSTRSTKKSHW